MPFACRRQLGDTHDHLHRFLHSFRGDKLMFAVIVVAAGKQVWARQSHK